MSNPKTSARACRRRGARLALALALAAGGAAISVEAGATDVGLASFYGHDHAGKRTASGQRFNPRALTAAHRRLPFGSRVRVTNLENGRSVVVSISDRGPYARGRIIDVSLGAARQLDFVSDGTARVRLDRM
jgi:rare lipoprotein A